MKYGELRTDKTWEETMLDLGNEFRKWEVKRWDKPSWKAAMASNGVVTVRFEAPNGKGWQEMTVARWTEPRINLRAIYMAVEAVRLMDQRGLGQVLAQASAHLALPAPKGVRSPEEILGINPKDGPKVRVDKARQRMLETHPDRGGKVDDFKVVREAAEKLELV